MDIRQLKRFVAVAELGSFNKAAERLAVSQPSLTRSIQLLEETLETRLFERGPRGILMTPMGEELLPHARIILNERDRAVASIDTLRSRGERLSIGTDAAFLAQRLPQALARIAISHPQTQVSVVEGAFREILAMVREGRVDIALGPRAPYLDLAGLSFEPLSIERASVLMRAGHPLRADGPPAREDLLRARWIVPDHPTVIEGWSQMFAQWKLPPPPIALHTASVPLVRSCLLGGDFVSICDCTTYAADIAAGRLIEVDLGMPQYQRPAGLFRRSGTRLSRSATAFVGLLRTICGEESAAGHDTGWASQP